MRVIVTGGAGFIGSHIVDALLAAGHQAFVIDNLESGSRRNLPASAPFFHADIRDAAAMARIFTEVSPDAVCHQAAQMSVSRSVREPALDAEINIMGWLHILDNAVKVGARRVVFASSGGVLYGDVTSPADEDHPAAPISPYGIAKLMGEKYLRFYCQEHGLTGVALRYANVYGPRQNPHGEAGVVAIFSKLLLAGEAATINGDGQYVRDYVYGPDVAQANLLALQTELEPGCWPFNVGTSVPTDVNELAHQIRGEVGKYWQALGRAQAVPEFHYGPTRAGDLRSSLVSAARAEARLGWRPRMTLADGIAETVRWFAEQAASESA